jgi:hypothetical protein
MPEYKLMEPFDIDNGELEGLRPQEVFCLGYEWRQIQDMLDTGDGISHTIHTPNANRIKRMCIRRARQCKVEDSGVEGWSFLEVAPT